jgi:hypothetical protein
MSTRESNGFEKMIRAFYHHRNDLENRILKTGIANHAQVLYPINCRKAEPIEREIYEEA